MTLNPSSVSFPSGVFSTCGSLWMGMGTCEVPLELFKLNRHRLCKALKKLDKGRTYVFLQGGQEVPFYNTSTAYAFRQEPFFMWTFGVLEPGCYGAIDVQTGTAHLFVPRLTKAQMVQLGVISLDTFSGRYNIRNVNYSDEMAGILYSLHPSQLLVLKSVNSDSGLILKAPNFPGIDGFALDSKILHREMTELRVIKTELEVNVMRYVVETSCEAHRKVMRYAKGGNKFEYQCEAEFIYHCHSVRGCRHMAKTCICASEGNTAVLNYGHGGAPNDRLILSSDMCLFSMGASYFGYSADVTCSFPASGRFTHDQRLIYESVLAASEAVLRALKPGVSFVSMHLLGLRVLFGELVASNLLQGDPAAMVDVGLGPIFQPHGLGHLLGMDVPDVGGYAEGQPPRRGEPPGVDKLKTARVLQPGMVLTVEPGCYFVDTLLDEALEDPVLSKFIVAREVLRFRGFGGVRIGNNVLVTENGMDNLSAKMPRTVKEIERWMAGKDDKKYKNTRRSSMTL